MQYYVHWYYGKQGSGKDIKNLKNSEKNSRYNEKIAKQLFNINRKRLVAEYKKVIKTTYSFTKNSEVNKFLYDERQLFSKSGFQQAVDEAFNLVHEAAPFFKMTDEEIAKSLVKDPKSEVVSFNKELEKTVRAMIKFMNNCTEIMNNGNTQVYLDFLKKYSGNSPGLREALSQLGDTKALRILTKTKEDLVESQFKELKNEEVELQSYIDNLNAQTSSVTKKGTVKSQEKNMVSYVRSLFQAQAQKAGELMEIIFTDVSNALIETKLIKNISNNPNIRVEHTGTRAPVGGGNTSFAKYTTDNYLSLRADIPTKLSMKRYKGFDGKSLSKVHLKNTNLRSMLNILEARTGLFGQQQRRAFYNTIANHRRHATKSGKGGGGGAVYSFKDINMYYNALNKIMLIPALAGSLTKEDLSTLFMINNKVYSIVDIIAQAAEYGTIGNNWNAINQQVRAGHRWKPPEENKVKSGQERSNEVIESILNSKLNLSLSLSLAQIKSL